MYIHSTYTEKNSDHKKKTDSNQWLQSPQADTIPKYFHKESELSFSEHTRKCVILLGLQGLVHKFCHPDRRGPMLCYIQRKSFPKKRQTILSHCYPSNPTHIHRYLDSDRELSLLEHTRKSVSLLGQQGLIFKFSVQDRRIPGNFFLPK